MKKFLAIALLMFVLFPPLHSVAGNSPSSGGMIDPGGISTNRLQEEQFLAEGLARKYKDEQRRYWLAVAGLLLFSLSIFEIGLRTGRRASSGGTSREEG